MAGNAKVVVEKPKVTVKTAPVTKKDENPKVKINKDDHSNGRTIYSTLSFNALMDEVKARKLESEAEGLTDSEKGRRVLRSVLRKDDEEKGVEPHLTEKSDFNWKPLLTILGILLAVVLIIWGFTSLSKRTDPRVNAIETEVSNLGTRVDGIDTQLSEVKTSVDEGFSEIKGLLNPVTDESVVKPIETPAAANTEEPAVKNNPAPAGVTVAACPTDAQMWKMVGLPENVKPVFHGESISWDSCQWQWQAYDTSVSIALPLPQDWVATVTLADGTVAVYRGAEGLTVDNVAGFNLRYVPAYPEEHWVRNDCAFLAQEIGFGLRRDPSYQTVAGNLVCENLAEINGCPTTVEQVSALIGGTPSQWTAPDWEGGAWVFKANPEEFVLLSIPASLNLDGQVVKLDYWNGQTNSAASLLPGNAGIALNEASFHCHLPTE